MTIRKEDINGGPEGGVVKCFSCIAHGRILLELLGKPSSVAARLMAIAMAHDLVTKGKHDIYIAHRHTPKAE